MSEDAKTCIIGLFDVLGYQSFLKNNSATDTAQEVLDTLAGLNQEVEQQMRENRAFATLVKPDVQWLIFSDTMLLVCTYPSNACELRFAAWFYMLSTSVFLSRYMLDYGLPIRGAIGFGKVLIKNNCFAGEPIVEAYQLATDLDLAATALTPEARNQFREAFKEVRGQEPGETLADDKVGNWAKRITVKYCAPRKSSSEDRIDMLNLEYVHGTHWKNLSGDVRQRVLDSFLSHNKDLPAASKSKLDNTELFLRYCISYTRECLQIRP